MSEQLRSMVFGTFGLDVAAAIALWLTLSRGGIHGDRKHLLSTARVAGLAIAMQAAHFAEELIARFHLRFPELLGLSPWPPGFFVAINLFWLAAWALAIRGVLGRRRAWLFPLWFLGIASLANGIAHPILSLGAGGYFPGLITSPFVGLAGVLLLRNLHSITAAGSVSVAGVAGKGTA